MKSIILYKMEANSSKQLETIKARKFAFPPSRQHLFLTVHRKHCIFFIGEESAFVVGYKEGKLETLKELKMTGVNPIHMTSSGNGDIHILQSGGILWQYLELLVQGAPFNCIDFPQEVRPLKLIPTAKDKYVIVLSDGELLFLQKGKIVKKCNYPSIMLLEQMVFDSTRRESFQARVVVPNQSLRFPFVFTGSQLERWSEEGYLNEVTQICQKYYLKDEYLPSGEFTITLSSSHNKIYVCLPTHVLILSVKRSNVPQVAFILQPRMMVRMNWQELPSFLNINEKTGDLLTVNADKITLTNYPDYVRLRMSFKQKHKDQNMFRQGYAIEDETLILISYAKDKTKAVVASR